MKTRYFSALRVLCVLTVGLLIGACRHTTQPPVDDCCHGVINVTAQDSSTGHAITGASVTLTGTTSAGDHVTHGPETTTDGGHTAFRELCAGRYEIHVAKDGYQTRESVVEMTCNDSANITSLLVSNATSTDCTSGRISLIIHDSATGHALSGGSATLYHSGVIISSQPLNPSGTVWEHLGTGAYSFRITLDGYNVLEFALDTVTCDAQRNVEHNMSAIHTVNHDTCCNGVVEATVVDSTTGHGIGGANVVLYKDGTQFATATSTDNGSIRFGSLCEGHYRMTIDKSGYAEGVLEFAEDCNATHGFHKALLANTTDNCCTAVMSLHLEDSIHNDVNLTGATVTIRIDGHSDNLVTGTTTDGGNYITDGLCGHTTYIVTFTKDGYNTKSITWQFTDCHTYTETFGLSHH